MIYLLYWEIAKEAIRKYDGIDGIFSTDQPALHYMHLAMKAGKRVPEDLKVVELMTEWILPDFVILK